MQMELDGDAAESTLRGDETEITDTSLAIETESS
jgi:hypothetical protein